MASAGASAAPGGAAKAEGPERGAAAAASVGANDDAEQRANVEEVVVEFVEGVAVGAFASLSGGWPRGRPSPRGAPWSVSYKQARCM